MFGGRIDVTRTLLQLGDMALTAAMAKIGDAQAAIGERIMEAIEGPPSGCETDDEIVDTYHTRNTRRREYGAWRLQSAHERQIDCSLSLLHVRADGKLFLQQILFMDTASVSRTHAGFQRDIQDRMQSRALPDNHFDFEPSDDCNCHFGDGLATFLRDACKAVGDGCNAVGKWWQSAFNASQQRRPSTAAPHAYVPDSESESSSSQQRSVVAGRAGGHDEAQLAAAIDAPLLQQQQPAEPLQQRSAAGDDLRVDTVQVPIARTPPGSPKRVLTAPSSPISTVSPAAASAQ
ncbi:hypothetical protein JKP88DRAFT_255940 [Tribonema minus]|uniref:Uncharacterized protein n=1 Tax=Tribonema minus TaxID=303371 RepID=A0A836C962_9STRA|nr:hypothetical protein JKP88DRAFT_248623 [Tribonema minus]KAG5182346.1 hypothetical protein JKP88DRAFT_255940 [Tribonema minus]